MVANKKRPNHTNLYDQGDLIAVPPDLTGLLPLSR